MHTSNTNEFKGRSDAWKRGRRDYHNDKRLVWRSREGKLRFAVDDDMGCPGAERDAWGAEYVDGWNSGLNS